MRTKNIIDVGSDKGSNANCNQADNIYHCLWMCGIKKRYNTFNKGLDFRTKVIPNGIKSHYLYAFSGSLLSSNSILLFWLTTQTQTNSYNSCF